MKAIVSNIATALLTTTLLLSASPAMAKTKSCKDFSTQQQAQVHYEALKRAGKRGWKSLDRDGDGRACDCNKGGQGKHCPTRK